MSEHLYLLTFGLPLLTILAVFGLRYAAIMLRDRARLSNDEAYRLLAEKAVAAQAETAASLAAMRQALDELAARTTGIEKVLKDVE